MKVNFLGKLIACYSSLRRNERSQRCPPALFSHKAPLILHNARSGEMKNWSTLSVISSDFSRRLFATDHSLLLYKYVHTALLFARCAHTGIVRVTTEGRYNTRSESGGANIVHFHFLCGGLARLNVRRCRRRSAHIHMADDTLAASSSKRSHLWLWARSRGRNYIPAGAQQTERN